MPRKLRSRKEELHYRSQVQIIFQDPFALAQSRQDDPPPSRPAACSSTTSCRAPARRTHPRAAADRGPDTARQGRREVPARTLGRAAAARRDRARARGRAEGRARRRADEHARRLDPDRDPQPDAEAEGGARPRVSLRHPRPRGSAVRRRRDPRHVRRPDRRAGADRAGARRAAASLHAAPARRRSGSRRRGEMDRVRGARVGGRRPGRRMPLRGAVPAGDPYLLRAHPAVSSRPGPPSSGAAT